MKKAILAKKVGMIQMFREDGTTELMRRAETPADYFATLDITGLFDK